MFSQCMFREAGAGRWISPSVSASLLKHSGQSECGIRKMSCFVFQTLILSRSVKLAIRKVSEIKCWDSWIQWTLRNSLHYINCDLRELRRVFLSCRLFWNINTNMSHTLITCSLFSLIIFESLVSEHLITLSSVQKFAIAFSVSEVLWKGLDSGSANFPKVTSTHLGCLLFPCSFEGGNSSLYLSAMWYQFCSVTHPLMQSISCTWNRSVIGGWNGEPLTLSLLWHEDRASNSALTWLLGKWGLISTFHEPAGLCGAQNFCVCGAVMTLARGDGGGQCSFLCKVIIPKENRARSFDFQQWERLPLFCWAVSYIFPHWYFLCAGKCTLIFVSVQSWKPWKIELIKALKKHGSARASLYPERSRQCFYCSIRTK